MRRRGRPKRSTLRQDQLELKSNINKFIRISDPINTSTLASESECAGNAPVEIDNSPSSFKVEVSQPAENSFNVNEESISCEATETETTTKDVSATETNETTFYDDSNSGEVNESIAPTTDENSSESVEMKDIESVNDVVEESSNQYVEKEEENDKEFAKLEEQMGSVAIDEDIKNNEHEASNESEPPPVVDVEMKEIIIPIVIKQEEENDIGMAEAENIEKSLEAIETVVEIKIEPEVHNSPDHNLLAKDAILDTETEIVKVVEPEDKANDNLMNNPEAFLYDFQDEFEEGNYVRRSRRLQSTYIEPLPKTDTLPSVKNETNTDQEDEKDEVVKIEVYELEPLTPQFKSQESEAKCNNFEIIKDNIHIKRAEKKSKKEGGMKTMKCDCTITEKEISAGKFGCKFNCINRLLYIECGLKCRCGDRCDNQQFQRYNYAPCSVFETDNKGFGIRAIKDIPSETFLIEYVGEVLDNKQFEKRAKKYSENKNEHFYFMALKTNAIIDATKKGNVSRFINHSCDPNAETQKWTVNNELRIGFFSVKDIKRGEEITFDYQYQRYGKEAQKCYCEATNCRGWIGENPMEDEEDEEIIEEIKQAKGRKGRKPKVQIDNTVPEPDLDDTEQEAKKEAAAKKVRKKKITEDLESESKISELESSGLKNSIQAISFARIVQRIKTTEMRSRMLTILYAAAEPCRRLFLDYHGLDFLYQWMGDLNVKNSIPNLKLCIQLIDVLRILPITNKTILRTSKIYDRVEKLKNLDLDKKKLSKEERKLLKAEKKKIRLQDSGEEQPKQQIGAEEMIKAMDAINEGDLDDLTKMKVQVKKHASELLVSWEALQEDFKIPKKKKQEAMIQHQLQADNNSDGWNESTNEQQRVNEKYKSRFGDDPNQSSHSRPFIAQYKAKQIDPQLSKLQRRKAFEKEIAQKDTEKRITTIHENNCQIFGLNPYTTIPLDVPVRVNRVTGEYITIDGRVVPPPPNHNQFKYEPLTQSTNPEDYVLPKIDLPDHWKYAIDEFGRIYYYHVKIRQSQWNVPPKIDPLSIDESEDEDSPDSDESTTETEDSEIEELTQLLQFLKRKKTLLPTTETSSSSVAAQNSSGVDDEDDLEKKIMSNMIKNPEPMKITQAVEKQRRNKKRHGLSSMRFIQPRTEADKIAARIDNKKYKEVKEKLRQKKRRILKGELQPGDDSSNDEDEDDIQFDDFGKPKFVDELEILERTSAKKKFEMDKLLKKPKQPTFDDPEMKRRFRDDMILVVTKYLQPYRDVSCEKGRIQTDDDFSKLMCKVSDRGNFIVNRILIIYFSLF